MCMWVNNIMCRGSIQCLSCCISLVCIFSFFFCKNGQSSQCAKSLFLRQRSLDMSLMHVFTATDLTEIN